MKKIQLIDIFDKIKKEENIVVDHNLHLNSRILLVDGMNTFLRSFAAINHVNLAGNHVGGLTGYLKSLGFAIKFLQPTRVINIFDGEGGSINRKYLYPKYKANRDNQRIVNFKSFNNKKEEDESKINEITRLIDYLRYLPVSSICVDKLEADDVIGYLSTKFHNEVPDSNVFIMSSDADFLQLINERITVYSPTKKKIYKIEDVLEEYKIHPENFIIYKSLVGDNSDNIPGVQGIGQKNISQLFEILEHPERKSLADIYEVCSDPPKKSVLYQRILNNMKMVEVFYKLINLREPNISKLDIENIHEQLNKPISPLKKYDFLQLYNYDQLGDTINGVDNWLDTFSVLNSFLNV